MATNGEDAPDPLNLLRAAISSATLPIPTISNDASTNTDVVPLEQATHLLFNSQSATEGAQHTTLDLFTPTRFTQQRAGALDLISAYFCWLNKDTSTQEYIDAIQAINEQRAKNGLRAVTNVVFTEKLDLINWLEDAEHVSDYIKRLDDHGETKKQAEDAADVARGDGDVVMGDAVLDVNKGGRREEERMKEIYAGERIMGDRNTVLRGIKPTDFSHVRKYSDVFLRRTAVRPTGPTPVLTTNSPALRNNKPSGRRPEPIILLSPSASSLLRLSNIKSFLVDGVFVPPTSASSTGVDMLHINRPIPSIDGQRPMRFILVETPDKFKPDYWSRVVAVFTTGQAWQFKGYKWQNPADLFSHTLGVHVGWRAETVPDTVKGWGRSVLSVGVDKWREGQTGQQRWRDREVVEEVWSAIEASMRAKGFGKEAR